MCIVHKTNNTYGKVNHKIYFVKYFDCVNIIEYQCVLPHYNYIAESD